MGMWAVVRCQRAQRVWGAQRPWCGLPGEARLVMAVVPCVLWAAVRRTVVLLELEAAARVHTCLASVSSFMVRCEAPCGFRPVLGFRLL